MSENKIKIAVFSGYGSCDIPHWLLKDLPTPIYGVESRIKLAKLLSELKPTHDANSLDLQKAWGSFSKSKSMRNKPYFKIVGENKVYLKICNESQTLPLTVEVSIQEVDITKPWRIDEYGGGESIKVFKPYKVVDEKYNLCEW